jgi:hypothetical protein
MEQLGRRAIEQVLLLHDQATVLSVLATPWQQQLSKHVVCRNRPSSPCLAVYGLQSVSNPSAASAIVFRWAIKHCLSSGSCHRLTLTDCWCCVLQQQRHGFGEGRLPIPATVIRDKVSADVQQGLCSYSLYHLH